MEGCQSIKSRLLIAQLLNRVYPAHKKRRGLSPLPAFNPPDKL